MLTLPTVGLDSYDKANLLWVIRDGNSSRPRTARKGDIALLFRSKLLLLLGASQGDGRSAKSSCWIRSFRPTQSCLDLSAAIVHPSRKGG